MASGKDWFGVRVVDEATGRGVPLVELETTGRTIFVTDSGGWAAIADPALMNREVFFHIRSHGYTLPKDGFGYAGTRLTPAPGKRATVKIKRVNIAERVCRLTGEGIYADSMLLGEPVPLQNPVLSGGVVGQDSALGVVYRGKMLWFWGDTNQMAYPLGNFRTSGAVATLPRGKRTADAGLDFAYFTGPSGFVRPMCPSKEPGPIWVFGVVVLGEGRNESLYAHYSRMKDLGTVLEHGYVRWNDRKNEFAFIRQLPLTEKWRFLDGHPIRWSENNTPYLAGGFCFPLARVGADAKRLLDPAAYEAFTCLTPDGKVRRTPGGAVEYVWQKEAPPITPEREAELVKAGQLRAEEARFLPRDEKGEPMIAHGGTVTWNPWRKKWLLIATRKGGKDAFLGEIWYSESDEPTGPWKRAIKILTHDRYTFYNPVHHPFLDTDGGRTIFLEGTYTDSFAAGHPRTTPRYDYNQMLYRLDLTDPRLTFAR